jgi:ankyrin repeat protein
MPPDYFQRFSELVMDKAVNVNCLNENYQTPLLLLSRSNKSDTLIDCIRVLLNRHCVNVNYQDPYNVNSLIAVCSSQNSQRLIEIVRLLLQRGIDIDAVENESHWTALFAVCYVSRSGVNNVAQLIQVLLDAGANVNTKANDGSNCLIAWSKHNHGHPDFILVLRLLIQRGIDLACTDAQNRNVLLIISELYCGPRLLEIVRLLVKSRINVHVRDNIGRDVVDILKNRGFQANSEIIQCLKY